MREWRRQRGLDRAASVEKSISIGLSKLYPFRDKEVAPSGCWAHDKEENWICTRESNHEGPHVAHGSENTAIMIWGDLTQEELEVILIKARLLA
jgi:hypothetical protein